MSKGATLEMSMGGTYMTLRYAGAGPFELGRSLFRPVRRIERSSNPEPAL